MLKGDRVRKVAVECGVDGDAAVALLYLADALTQQTGHSLTLTNIGPAVREAATRLTKFYEQVMAAPTERALKIREKILHEAVQ